MRVCDAGDGDSRGSQGVGRDSRKVTHHFPTAYEVRGPSGSLNSLMTGSNSSTGRGY